MNVFFALMKLKALDESDDIWVKKEKYTYLINRTLRVFNKKFPIFTMGETLGKDIIVKNSYGVFYCRARTFDLHIISDTYEYKVRKLFEKLARKSKIIVDVGANIGKYSILACKVNPQAKVFAIEPEKGNFEVLKRNKKLNNCKNLELIKIALSDKNKKVKLYKDEINTGGHSIISTSDKKNYEIVESKKFDDIFKDKVDKIDLMKIDVEGAELKVLKGAKYFLKNKRIKNIIIEISNPKSKELLENFGYSLKHIKYNNFFCIHMIKIK